MNLLPASTINGGTHWKANGKRLLVVSDHTDTLRTLELSYQANDAIFEVAGIKEQP